MLGTILFFSYRDLCVIYYKPLVSLWSNYFGIWDKFCLMLGHREKIIQLDHSSPVQQCRLGKGWLESWLSESGVEGAGCQPAEHQWASSVPSWPKMPVSYCSSVWHWWDCTLHALFSFGPLSRRRALSCLTVCQESTKDGEGIGKQELWGFTEGTEIDWTEIREEEAEGDLIALYNCLIGDWAQRILFRESHTELQRFEGTSQYHRV